MASSERFDRRAHEILNKTIAFAALLGPDGTVRDVSDNALTAGGIVLQDVLGRPFWEGTWFSHDPELQDLIRKSVATARDGTTARFDILARIVNDGRLNVDYQISPIQDDEGNVAELLASGFDVTERERTKARLELALRDSTHRIKNIFSTVRAMARMTKHHAPPDRAMDEFLSRFEALSAVHHVLDSSRQLGFARFEDIAQVIARPHLSTSEPERFSVSGPQRLLARDPAKLLALCIHELMTNAVKYGALSRVGGTIRLSLTEPDEAGVAAFCWQETFNAEVPPPTRKGFGNQFIDLTLRTMFAATPTFEATALGLCVSAGGPVTDLFETGNDHAASSKP